MKVFITPDTFAVISSGGDEFCCKIEPEQYQRFIWDNRLNSYNHQDDGELLKKFFRKRSEERRVGKECPV